MRSDKIKKGFERAPHRSLLKATGLVSDEDFSKPFIAIVNSYVDIIPGHVHLQEFGRKIRSLFEQQVVFLLNSIQSVLMMGLRWGTPE